MPLYLTRLRTALPPDEASRRVAGVTGASVDLPTAIVNAFSDGLPAQIRSFEGEVNDKRFTIQRRISKRNAFLPTIRGRITPDGSGSVVRLLMHLHLVPTLFLALVVAIALQWSVFTPGHVNWSSIYVVLIACVFTLVGFVPQARLAKRMLALILDKDYILGQTPTVSR